MEGEELLQQQGGNPRVGKKLEFSRQQCGSVEEERGGLEDDEGTTTTTAPAAQASEELAAALNPSLPPTKPSSPSPSPYQASAPDQPLLSPALLESQALSQPLAPVPTQASPFDSPATLAFPMKYIPVSRLYSPQPPKPPTNASPAPPLPPPTPCPPPSPPSPLSLPPFPSSSSSSSPDFLPFFYSRRRNIQQRQDQATSDSSLQTQFVDMGHTQKLINGIEASQQPQPQKADRTKQKKQNSRLQLQVQRRKLPKDGLRDEQQNQTDQDSIGRQKDIYRRLQRRLDLQGLTIDRKDKREIRTSRQRRPQYRQQHMRYPVRKYLTRLSATSQRLSLRDRDALVRPGTMLPILSKRRKEDQERSSGTSAKKKKLTEERKIPEIEGVSQQHILPHDANGHTTMSCVVGYEEPHAEIGPGSSSDSLPAKYNQHTDALCSIKSDMEDINLTSRPQNVEAPTNSNEVLPLAEESMEGMEKRSMKPVVSALIEEVVSSTLASGMRNNEMVTRPELDSEQIRVGQSSEEKKVEEVNYYYRRRVRSNNVAANGLVDALQNALEVKDPFTVVERNSDFVASVEHKTRSVSPKVPSFSTMDEGRFFYSTRKFLSAAKQDSCKVQSLKSRHIDKPSQALSSRKAHTNSMASPKGTPVRLTKVQALTSNGYHLDNESKESPSRIRLSSGAFPSRKKRKMQKVTEISNLSAGKSTDGISEDVSTREVSMSFDSKLLLDDTTLNWRDVDVEATDPEVLMGCKCMVYWPIDDDWYIGRISQYNMHAGTYHVIYDDGDEEDINLAKERIKFNLSQEEMEARNIKSGCVTEGKRKLDYQEMAALAGLEDIQGDFGHGELVWAKIKGHPMWPAFVMDEKHADACGLETPVREGTLPVQFFGSYDYARISSKQAVSFSGGLLCKMYSKCKRMAFDRGLKEAERYLKERKLPEIMSQLQDKMVEPTDQNERSTEANEEDEDFMGDERMHKTKKSVQSLFTCPIKLGALQVLSLGKIVRDSEYFHDEHHIWTEGYTAVRRFTSTKDPSKLIDYKMEVMKDPNARTLPLFRVSWDAGEQVEGSTPYACWKKIYQKLEKVREKHIIDRKRQQFSSGASMFGFTNPRISKLIQALPYSRVCSKYTGWFDKLLTEHTDQLLPAGFKAVQIEWNHPDRCSVCYLDEEYVNNLFLQCDKCRILVHMHCYGESEPPNGHLWLCQLCRPEAPAKNPLCCLCPVQGGAMKRTTDGRWAHLTCAMWIPETCFVDIKQMEPIDGLKSINKERWKLTCSICKVPYGVCIQCSELSCCVAYHILCARSAGFVLEVLEESSHKASHKDMSPGEDFEQPIRLLSYCRRHRQPKEDRDVTSQQIQISKQIAGDCSDYIPPQNTSGCARTEPYNCSARRGRQEPEVRAAASAKRLYVEKMPYRVSSNQNGNFSCSTSQEKCLKTNRSQSQMELKAITFQGNTNESAGLVAGEESLNLFSMSDRYQQMRSSLKQRLTFGKSAIHGWGVFTKQKHLAGDMVIEYAGEIVRPIVADLRERRIYNSLVGAGTYMFRIDDERVVDATRVGSIAHLINHSCEPNCFSRVVAVNGDEHIIIFAKRDIEVGDELSYDYRFTSKGEQLECYCGFPSCRGFVNADDADEEPARILVPRREVLAWILSGIP